LATVGVGSPPRLYYVTAELSVYDHWHVDTNEGNVWRRVSKRPLSHEEAVVLCERLNREAERDRAA
jgi:hypothetical protein